MEHVNCHPIVIIQLTCLFNCMMSQGYVPDAFGTGATVPVIKNVDSDSGSVDNYRGITISPILSKLFEMCMLLRLSHFLKSSHLQYGFKEHYSCAHAIYTVKEVLNYFNKQHSTANLAALDISKAFDKVNHVTFFNKLLDRGIPADLIKVLVCWYHKCTAVVRWNEGTSRLLNIFAGVRQGGILSPLLFAVYIDDIVTRATLC